MKNQPLTLTKPEPPQGPELERAAQEATDWNPNIYRANGQFGALNSVMLSAAKGKRFAISLLLTGLLLLAGATLPLISRLRAPESTLSAFEIIGGLIYASIALLCIVRAIALLRGRA